MQGAQQVLFHAQLEVGEKGWKWQVSFWIFYTVLLHWHIQFRFICVSTAVRVQLFEHKLLCSDQCISECSTENTPRRPYVASGSFSCQINVHIDWTY